MIKFVDSENVNQSSFVWPVMMAEDDIHLSTVVSYPYKHSRNHLQAFSLSIWLLNCHSFLLFSTTIREVVTLFLNFSYKNCFL